MTRSNVIRIMLCALALHAAAASALAQTNVGPGRPAGSGAPATASPVQGFSVVLVLGSLKDLADTVSGELPRGAQRALADLTDFLPYRSYRLLDSAWILNTGSGRATSRVRGTENRQYEVSLESAAAGTSTLGVKFTLREGTHPTAAVHHPRPPETNDARQAQIAVVGAQIAELESRLASLVKTLPSEHPDVAETRNRMRAARSQLDALRAGQDSFRASQDQWLSWFGETGARVIDTSFTMDSGETVVVGTSRIQGDTALIVLLTAVPRGSK